MKSRGMDWLKRCLSSVLYRFRKVSVIVINNKKMLVLLCMFVGTENGINFLAFVSFVPSAKCKLI